jgi:hypothetical protein
MFMICKKCGNSEGNILTNFGGWCLCGECRYVGEVLDKWMR